MQATLVSLLLTTSIRIFLLWTLKKKARDLYIAVASAEHLVAIFIYSAIKLLSPWNSLFKICFNYPALQTASGFLQESEEDISIQASITFTGSTGLMDDIERKLLDKWNHKKKWLFTMFRKKYYFVWILFFSLYSVNCHPILFLFFGGPIYKFIC